MKICCLHISLNWLLEQLKSSYLRHSVSLHLDLCWNCWSRWLFHHFSLSCFLLYFWSCWSSFSIEFLIYEVSFICQIRFFSFSFCNAALYDFFYDSSCRFDFHCMIDMSSLSLCWILTFWSWNLNLNSDSNYSLCQALNQNCSQS